MHRIARIEGNTVHIWFIDRRSRNQTCLWNFNFYSPALFCLFSSYFFVSSFTFCDGFFHFQDTRVSLKQAPGHNHETRYFSRYSVPLRGKKSRNCVPLGNVMKYAQWYRFSYVMQTSISDCPNTWFVESWNKNLVCKEHYLGCFYFCAYWLIASDALYQRLCKSVRK